MSSSRYHIPVQNISTYLTSEGWQPVKGNANWHVFHGMPGNSGEEFEIVIPTKTQSSDYPLYVMHMIEILASLMDKSHESIAEEIRKVCRDILLVRTQESDNAQSIPMYQAAKQIPNLKQLVAYAACSEKSQRTHYRNSGQGKAMAQHFRYGQTLSEGVGYSVESDVGDNLRLRESSDHLRQLDIFVDQNIDEIAPLERRVMERIVRGIAATIETARLGDLQHLVAGYGSGLNANMCYALLQMSDVHSQPIEFDVIWSKKIAVSGDVQQHRRLQIDRTHIGYLKDAHTQLKEIKPEKISIEGRVTALSSDEDPRSELVDDRSIMIRVSTGQFKNRKIRLALGKQDYARADEAHMNWKTISVTGVMHRIGSHWILSDPHDFRIIR